jgi:hypothetical protein
MAAAPSLRVAEGIRNSSRQASLQDLTGDGSAPSRKSSNSVLAESNVNMKSRSSSPALSNRGLPGANGTAGAMSSGGRGMFKPFTLIEYKGMRFVVMDAPSDANLLQYIKELERHSVTDMVRACEPTYSSETVASHGITLHVRPFLVIFFVFCTNSSAFVVFNLNLI